MKNAAFITRAGLLVAVMLWLAACGITAPRDNEGFANLESLGVLDTDRTVTLSIGPVLLHIAAEAVDEDEPETAALLRGLDGVRVRIYEIDGNAERVASRIRRMGEHLRRDRWQPVMLVQEQGEQTQMLVRSSGDRIQGLTLITSDRHEAVVINLMGNLEPRLFSDVMEALDVDAPSVEVADPAM